MTSVDSIPYVVLMDAESTIECTCEMCRPNWYLGRDDKFVTTPPEPVSEAELARLHALKVREAGLDFALTPQT